MKREIKGTPYEMYIITTRDNNTLVAHVIVNYTVAGTVYVYVYDGNNILTFQSKGQTGGGYDKVTNALEGQIIGGVEIDGSFGLTGLGQADNLDVHYLRLAK